MILVSGRGSCTILLLRPSLPDCSGLSRIDLGVAGRVVVLRDDRCTPRCDPLAEPPLDDPGVLADVLLLFGTVHWDNPDLASLSPVPGED